MTERSKENCMDSKNLAICWWPTILQYEFGDLTKVKDILLGFGIMTFCHFCFTSQG